MQRMHGCGMFHTAPTVLRTVQQNSCIFLYRHRLHIVAGITGAEQPHSTAIGEPLKTINNSYEKNEIALTNVNVGRYTVTFEHVDPDNVNKVVQVGTIKNVEVKQGKDMSAAKTELSTADAEMEAN